MVIIMKVISIFFVSFLIIFYCSNVFSLQFNDKFYFLKSSVIKMFKMSKGLSNFDKIDTINTFFNNNIVYKDDYINHKIEDYWSSPNETLISGYGDCEDFAIIKYYSLLRLNFEYNKLVLIYAMANIDNKIKPHIVLGVYIDNHKYPLILDNLTNEIRFINERNDLELIFIFNSIDLWISDNNGDLLEYPAHGLYKWKSVLERINNSKSLLFR